MPLYEFSCRSCHETSEHLMKISDKSPESCPFCHKEGSLKKLMSRSNFVLKGTGWYETDFKEKKKVKEKKTEKESVTASSSSEKPKASASKSAVNKKAELQPTSSSLPASKST